MQVKEEIQNVYIFSQKLVIFLVVKIINEASNI